jgi:hypothetical protein
MVIYFSYFCTVLKPSKVGNFAVRLALVAYVIIYVAALFPVSGTAPDCQKQSFSSKSVVGGISLLLNEEKEKESEGDEHDAFMSFISFDAIHRAQGISTKDIPTTDFHSCLNAAKIYLQHCSLQI